MKLIIYLLTILFLTACEGKQGPIGPAGPQGKQGPQGEQGLTGDVEILLIEETFAEDDYEEEFSSFYINDFRIDADSVIGIYVKAFYTNTGDPYYTPIKNWADSRFIPDSFVVQVITGRVRLFDPNKNFVQETVVVAVIQ